MLTPLVLKTTLSAPSISTENEIVASRGRNTRVEPVALATAGIANLAAVLWAASSLKAAELAVMVTWSSAGLNAKYALASLGTVAVKVAIAPVSAVLVRVCTEVPSKREIWAPLPHSIWLPSGSASKEALKVTSLSVGSGSGFGSGFSGSGLSGTSGISGSWMQDAVINSNANEAIIVRTFFMSNNIYGYYFISNNTSPRGARPAGITRVPCALTLYSLPNVAQAKSNCRTLRLPDIFSEMASMSLSVGLYA